MSCDRKDTEMRSDRRAIEPPSTDCSLISAINVSIVYTGTTKERDHRGWGGGVPAGSEGRREKRRDGGGPGRLESRAVWDEMEVRQGELRQRWRRREGRPGPSSCRSPFCRLTEILTPSIFLPLSAFKLPLAGPLRPLHNWATASDASLVTGKQGGVCAARNHWGRVPNNPLMSFVGL